ncbi:hypothetical protein CDD81_6553 [Ophiocordyceps australis]|uniref:Uncharacterized protein n=1 Tax=Ophiocordyceps australis TaxID=1399860 RepID=A0A2C5Y671_9HYPO|nr:hypothetical protein CDD81_6553 [Ophiocordyceps australis]
MTVQRLALRATALARTRPTFAPVPFAALASSRFSYSSWAPVTVLDLGFWKSLLPKALRKGNVSPSKPKSKEWNPVTYFIWIFIFIGSMSIQMIALRNQMDVYLRQSAVRIRVLGEVVERIQSGQDVDVEEALGTGNPQKEAEWKKVLEEIEHSRTITDPTARESKNAKAKEPQSRSRAARAQSDGEEASKTKAQAAEKKATGLDGFF